jgi:hypothetical protein
MALNPQAIPPIPEETARLAHQIWPKGHRSLQLREELGTIYTDELFVDLYPKLGSFAEAPWRIALVCVMGVTWKATRIVRPSCAMQSRIDWKYVQSTGTSRSWLRLFGALRVSQPLGQRQPRRPLVECAAVPLSRARLAQRARQATRLPRHMWSPPFG